MTLADLCQSYQKLLVVALETGLDGAAGKYQMRGECVTILTDDLDIVCAYIVRNRLPAVHMGETNQRMLNSKRKQAPVTSDNTVRNTTEIESLREQSKQQLRSSWESIFERYGKDFDDECDIIEMGPRMHLVKDRGHVHSLDTESDEDLEEIDTSSYQEPGKDDEHHSTSEDEPMNEFDDSMNVHVEDVEGPCEMEVGAETFKASLEESARTVLDLLSRTKPSLSWNFKEPSVEQSVGPLVDAHLPSPYQRLVHLCNRASVIDGIINVTHQVAMICAYALYSEYREQCKLYWETHDPLVSWESGRSKSLFNRHVEAQGIIIDVRKLYRGARVFRLVERFGPGVLFSEEMGTASSIENMRVPSFNALLEKPQDTKFQSDTCVGVLDTIIKNKLL